MEKQTQDFEVTAEIRKGYICDIDTDDPSFVPLLRVNLLTEEFTLRYTKRIHVDPNDPRIEAMYIEGHKQLIAHKRALKGR